ncbi:MAG: ribosome biogenesis/translation initiation ATPase RLI [archaeon]|nr:MAG: ribosome biogenesis/translation initiation ATPase RLI [archaeon]
MRIAVIDYEKCNPKKCSYECIRFCPRNRAGDKCIFKGEEGKPIIDENICIGCGICIKKCPFRAIQVVNLPEALKENPVHRFGRNGFVLYRLPIPTPGKVIGLLGSNGTGKSTALKILSGKLEPNLGGSETSIEKMFRGNELQDYFGKLAGTRTVYKPQQVDQIPEIYKGKVTKVVNKKGKEFLERLHLSYITDRDVSDLSGGELQRLAIAMALSRDGDFYFIDEPSSYLDVRERLEVGKLIREVSREKTVMVVEHDLATLDFMADQIHIFYGTPGVYGIVSKPYGVRVGINTFLHGYIKEDNVRMRPEPIRFEVISPTKEKENPVLVRFSEIKKKLEKFILVTEPGRIYAEDVLGIFGANALGKTTFARIMSGELEPDSGLINPRVRISYKPQYIHTNHEGTVGEVLRKNSNFSKYKNYLLGPLSLERLMDSRVKTLSGGEAQRLVIALCLLQDAEMYLLDEPSAYLDVEQRLAAAKVIQNIVKLREATCMVIDHDLLFLDFISRRGMVFLGEPGKEGMAKEPAGLEKAFNTFLKDLKVTFRRDPENGRPRANKPESVKDREQKEKGNYYYS